MVDEILVSLAHTAVEVVFRQADNLIGGGQQRAARNAVLVVGMEEGLFYRPNANHAIRFFVVVAIRNSLLETICSDDYHEAGLSDHLNDDQIKQVTQDAIIHFGKLDFSDLCKRVDGIHQYTYFADILSKYPVATEALKRIDIARIRARRPPLRLPAKADPLPCYSDKADWCSLVCSRGPCYRCGSHRGRPRAPLA